MVKEKENEPDKVQNPAYDPSTEDIQRLADGNNEKPEDKPLVHDHPKQAVMEQPPKLDALAEALGELGFTDSDLSNTAQDPANTERRHEALKKVLQDMGFALTKDVALVSAEPVKETTVLLMHPHLGYRVPVKESLQDEALSQGFRK